MVGVVGIGWGIVLVYVQVGIVVVVIDCYVQLVVIGWNGDGVVQFGIGCSVQVGYWYVVLQYVVIWVWVVIVVDCCSYGCVGVDDVGVVVI